MPYPQYSLAWLLKYFQNGNGGIVIIIPGGRYAECDNDDIDVTNINILL